MLRVSAVSRSSAFSLITSGSGCPAGTQALSLLRDFKISDHERRRPRCSQRRIAIGSFFERLI